MLNDFRFTSTDCVIASKGEFLVIACFAIIGIVGIVKKIADDAYEFGKFTKEREMNKELKYKKKI